MNGLLWCTKLQFLKDIHNLARELEDLFDVVMMYKVTIFERYTQPSIVSKNAMSSCYDVQSYNFWKIYTTFLLVVVLPLALLWCTKLQFLKDIHNCGRVVFWPELVVMMYKVTIFERYTQHLLKGRVTDDSCYDVQSYNFWKIYTTFGRYFLTEMVLLWCTKLQFLKDIHNWGNLYPWQVLVVMMYKVTIFERYTQQFV